MTARSVRTGAVPEILRQPGRQLACSTRQIRGPQLAQPIVVEASANGSGAMGEDLSEWNWAQGSLCHSLVYEDMASRPPVQAILRLAAARPGLGPPAMPGILSATREWRTVNEFA
jgi:hypothetical protein